MLNINKLESYYSAIIKHFNDEDEIVYFLNKPEILRKFTDDDREWLVLKWLKEQGWVEVNEEDIPDLPHKVVMEFGYEKE